MAGTKKKKKKKSINHSFLDGYFKYLAEIVLIWVSAGFFANTGSPGAHTRCWGWGGEWGEGTGGPP